MTIWADRLYFTELFPHVSIQKDDVEVEHHGDKITLTATVDELVLTELSADNLQRDLSAIRTGDPELTLSVEGNAIRVSLTAEESVFSDSL